MTSAPTPPRSALGAYRIALAALTLLVFATAWAWSLVLPPFSGPDEGSHYNSITRVIAGGGWPAPYEARIEQWTITAVTEAGRTYRGQSAASIPVPTDRSPMLAGGGWTEAARDQMVQHPPAYYFLVAGVVDAVDGFSGGSLRWDQALLTMRLCSALLVAASVPFITGIAHRVTRSRRAGIVGAALLLCVPYFSNAAGFATNDALLVLACSASLYFVLRAADAAVHRPWWLAASGLALGIALATKGLALLLIPVVTVLAVRAVRPVASRMTRVAGVLLPLAVAFCIGGWWWLRNLLTLGKLQPSGLGERESSATGPDDYDLLGFLLGFVGRVNRTFWGRGAVEDFALPPLAAEIAGLVFVAVLVVALVVARRRGILLLLWTFPALILVTILLNSHSIYWDLGIADRGIQGRYVFAGISAFAATCAVVFAWATGRVSARVRGAIAAGTVAAAAIVTWASMAYVVLRAWPDDAGSPVAFAAMRTALGVGEAPYIAAGVIALAAVVTAVWAVRRVPDTGSALESAGSQLQG